MHVTSVKIVYPKSGEDARLLAYCSLVLDDSFAVNEIRLVRNAEGRTFLAMPGRQLRDRCPSCDSRNDLLNRYCCQCGIRLAATRDRVFDWTSKGEPRLHMDQFHPVTREARMLLEQAVIARLIEDGRASGCIRAEVLP